ncbi:Mn2+/Fe2+ NRAMP family transporter [Sporomusaceae bacterium BoRhaA]|uniref:Nramp family divalent metal transporter n=1 Tax=Pelorhabdus rhamnosifermentans TaxID=2772457 RepID=UPI001C063F27|nr:Nramp family divalent metal transporter [Pelorhabdus rhamnosifermentans]MBU2702193.1 Mn2+/Fe2+ NRAMP family transporter [Pelorhabdus rhamnosifermentans]
MNFFKNKFAQLGLFFSVIGPGIVTAFADNDAGGIATYAAAGAKYGYGLLFTMFISSICLAIAQEISARTGVVTGRGLSDLIRERFGVKWTLFAMVVLLIANIGTTASEFSGIATSFEIFGISKYLSVPIMSLLIWWLVLKANYNRIEKIFLLLCVTFLSYIISGVIVDPPWKEVLLASVTPTFFHDADFLLMAIGVIGTTITPWGQFYVQASVVDKGITAKDYHFTFWDVMIGAFFTWLIAFFIIVATAATLYANQISIETAGDAALALAPLAGKYASMLFSFGLLGASMLAAFILPLSTAYAVCEAFGFERGISKTQEEAPVFFGLYTALIILGAALVLWPDVSLYQIMLTSQVINGILLPPILIFMVLIANDKNIMGSFANSPWYSIVSWIFTWVLIILTILLVFSTVMPDSIDMLMNLLDFATK